MHGRSLCELHSCVSSSEGIEDTPECFCTLASVLQEACESLHVCKGEGACVHAYTRMTCESCQHVGHVHEWVCEVGLGVIGAYARVREVGWL